MDPQANANSPQVAELSSAFVAQAKPQKRKLTDPVVRANLVKALMDGGKPDELAGTFGCSPQAIRLFRSRHVRPAMAIARANYDADVNKLPAESRSNSAVKLAETGAAVAKHVAGVERYKAKLDSALDKASDARDISTLVDTGLRAIVLNAKLDGSLTTVQVVDNSVHVALLLSGDRPTQSTPQALITASFVDDPELG